MLFGAAGLLGLIGVIPGLPHVPFLLMAIGAGRRLAARSRSAAGGSAAEERGREAQDPGRRQAASPWPDILRLELGAALVPFVNEPWKLAEKIQALQAQTAR